jgi:hypothetical protein
LVLGDLEAGGVRDTLAHSSARVALALGVALIVVMALAKPLNVYTATEKLLVTFIETETRNSPQDRMCCPVPPTREERWVQFFKMLKALETVDRAYPRL